MRAYPINDYLQLTKADADNNATEQATGVYRFNIGGGNYYSNQRSSVSTIECVSASCKLNTGTGAGALETLMCGLVNPTPQNVYVSADENTCPSILVAFDGLGTTTGTQAVYQQENPTYMIGARPSNITIKFYQDGANTAQANIDGALDDFIVVLKCVYYDAKATISEFESQFQPTEALSRSIRPAPFLY